MGVSPGAVGIGVPGDGIWGPSSAGSGVPKVQVHGTWRQVQVQRSQRPGTWCPGGMGPWAEGGREQRVQSPGARDPECGGSRAQQSLDTPVKGTRRLGHSGPAARAVGHRAVGGRRRAVPGHTRRGHTPVPALAGPGLPYASSRPAPARPRGWRGPGPGSALRPAHVCTHVLVAELGALGCLQRVTFACSHSF